MALPYYVSAPLSPKLATPVKRRPRWDFSVPGLMYCSMMMFMGIAAMNTQANLLFGVFGLMIGVLLVCVVISRLVLVRLTVRRVLPETAIVGQPVAVGYEFHNGKRFWPSLSVQVAELDGVEAFRRQPHAYLLHAAAREDALTYVEVTPKRRGLYQLDQYQIATSFPFGFVKRAVIRHQDDSILVFPPMALVDQRVLRLLRSAETAGVTVRPRKGGEDEMFGLKEYRPGENVRLIHWKRTARTGQVVMREMTRVSPPRVLILVDTLLRSQTAAGYEAVERTIATASSLASFALGQGLMVGVAAPTPGGAEGNWVQIEPSRGKRHRRDVLSALAMLPRNLAMEAKTLMEQALQSTRPGTTVVVITPHDMEQGLAEQARGNIVVIAALGPAARQWFTFPETIDFRLTMPADQQPDVDPPPPAAASKAGGGKSGSAGKTD